MAIICGIDSSQNAAQASRAAAAVAKRSNMPLKLVHVIERVGDGPKQAAQESVLYDSALQQTREQAAELGQRFGIDVEAIVIFGAAYEKLIEVAHEHQARLIVTSALSDKDQHRWMLGTVAERVAQNSTVPVLTVREAASIEEWASGKRPLRVLLGVDISSTSKAALHWAMKLRSIAPCDVKIVQIAWPLGEHQRLGLSTPVPLDRLRPELHDVLMRDLRSWTGDVTGEGETTFEVIPGWGRVDSHLAELAAETMTDLLVVGAHQRSRSARFWQGSVSRGVLHGASCNVACVPRVDAYEEETAIPVFQRVLIPTDFSSLANTAIPVGYGLVAPGGIVHLLHVVTGRPGEMDDNAKAKLTALIPRGAAAKGVLTQIEIIEDKKAGMGIVHAAGRLGVDAICMATRGRSGVSAVLGSQAQEVVHRARQPVLLTPPEREI